MYFEIRTAPTRPPPGPKIPGEAVLGPVGSLQHAELLAPPPEISPSSKATISRPSRRNARDARILGTHSCRNRSADVRPPGRPSTQGAADSRQLIGDRGYEGGIDTALSDHLPVGVEGRSAGEVRVEHAVPLRLGVRCLAADERDVVVEAHVAGRVVLAQQLPLLRQLL